MEEIYEATIGLLKPPSEDQMKALREQGWELENTGDGPCIVQQFESRIDAHTAVAALLGTAQHRRLEGEYDYASVLIIKAGPPGEESKTAKDFDDGDAFLFNTLDKEDKQRLAVEILERRHGVSPQAVYGEYLVNAFQLQRVQVMKNAVATSAEVNRHLGVWRFLGWIVGPLLVLTSAASYFFLWEMLKHVEDQGLNGWQLVVLIFVLALMAVSPATLLLIGRPLQGLDAWSPSKLDKDADTPPTDPAKDSAGGTNKEEPDAAPAAS